MSVLARCLVVTCLLTLTGLTLPPTAPAGSAAAEKGPRQQAKQKRRCVKRKHVARRVDKRRARKGLNRSPARCHASPIPSKVRLKPGPKLQPEQSPGGFAQPQPPGFGENGDDPGKDEEEEEQEARPELPVGPYIKAPPSPAVPLPAGAEEAPVDPEARAAGAVGDIRVTRNVDLAAASQAISKGLKPNDGFEQSVASNGSGLVLYTANTFAAASVNGGRSFTDLKLTATDGTAIFEPEKGGVCCDQRVLYIPSADRFVWIIQYQRGTFGTPYDTLPNAFVLATATSAQFEASGGRSWTEYVIEPSDFGLKPDTKEQGVEMDHPTITATRRFLYLTFLPFTGKKGDVGTQISRIELSQLGGAINLPNYNVPKGSEVIPAVSPPGVSVVQYMAHFMSNSRLEVLEFDDDRKYTLVLEVDVPTVGSRNFRSLTPAGSNWLLRTASKSSLDVFSGTRAGRKVWFAWVAGRDARVKRNGKVTTFRVHDQPSIEAIAMDYITFRRTDYATIEYADAATDVPEIRANAAGDVGISYRFGGPEEFPTHAVGFLGNNYAAAVMVSSNRDEAAVAGTFAQDYSGLAVDPGQPNCFVAAGAAVKDGRPNYIDPHYAAFGRAGTGCRNPLPPDVIVQPPPSFAQPDLVISDLSGTTVTVKNSGSADAGPFAVTVELSQTGETKRFVLDGGLAAGQSRSFSFLCRSGIWVGRADADQQVAESNESNNVRGFSSNCEA